MFGDALMSLSPAGCSPLAPALPQKEPKRTPSRSCKARRRKSAA